MNQFMADLIKLYVVCRTIGKDLLFFGGSIVVIRVLAVLLVEGGPQTDTLAP